jgi:hypothetical protein
METGRDLRKSVARRLVGRSQMPKKPASKSARHDAAGPRTFLGGIDAAELVELLENHFTDTGGDDGSPYRRLYRQSLAMFLAAEGQEAVHFAALLNSVDAAIGVECAMRSAGFIVGFQTCRQLLLGDLDLDAVKRESGGGK